MITALNIIGFVVCISFLIRKFNEIENRYSLTMRERGLKQHRYSTFLSTSQSVRIESAF